MPSKASPGLPAIFACSPSSGGMSDQAARVIAQSLEQAGVQARTFNLRDHKILPCTGCQRCRFDPERACFLSDLDDSAPLFQAMQDAPFVFFASPIYFYHVPATFKAFIDRSQRFYYSRLDNDPAVLELPGRPAYACLVAGRSRGDRLFEGSLLTLKYFLEVFNFSLAESLLCKGMDEIASLAERPDCLDDLQRLALRALHGFNPD